MDCVNHPGLAAVSRCAGCAESFCNSCVVDIQGQKYCGSCKVMAVQNQPLGYQTPTQAGIPCKEAGEALTYSIVGLFCFGIVLEPIALVKANKARQMMRLNPNLTGSGKVTAATIIASVGLGLWILGLIGKFAAIGRP